MNVSPEKITKQKNSVKFSLRFPYCFFLSIQLPHKISKRNIYPLFYQNSVILNFFDYL